MRKLLSYSIFLCAFIFGCSKSDQAPTLERATIIPFTLQPIATSSHSPTTTLTPSATFLPISTTHPLQSFLPEECNNENRIPAFSDRYELFGAGACFLPTISPDGEYIAFGAIIKTGEGDDWNKDYNQVVKVTRIDDKTTFEIYHMQVFTILGVYWSVDGRLVIVDGSTHCCRGGFTHIYDIKLNHISHSFEGNVIDRWWNPTYSAFYIKFAEGIFPPRCLSVLQGFDFQTNKSLPLIGSLSIDSKKIIITEGPYWVEDGRVLIMTIRNATSIPPIVGDYDNYRYGPAKVLMIDLRGTEPQSSLLHSNPDLDYSIEVQENGNYEIITSARESITCHGDI